MFQQIQNLNVGSHHQRSGGFLDHIECSWKVTSENDKDLQIFMGGNQIFTNVFEFSVTFAICVNSGHKNQNKLRILVFTTDYIYQLSVTKLNATYLIQYEPEKFEKIVTNQIEFTTAKQHPATGIVIAGGSNGVSIQIDLQKATDSKSSTFLDKINPFKQAKRPSDENKLVDKALDKSLRYKLYNLFSFSPSDEYVKSISFTQNSLAVLVVSRSSKNLSKINFYSLQKVLQISIPLRQYSTQFVFESSIYLKKIYRLTQETVEIVSQTNHSLFQKTLPDDFKAMHIQFANQSQNQGKKQVSGVSVDIEEDQLLVYLQNGMVLGLCNGVNYFKVSKIDLPSFDRVFNVHKFVNDEILNRQTLSKVVFQELQQSDDQTDPLFQNYGSQLNFKGSEDSLSFFLPEQFDQKLCSKSIFTSKLIETSSTPCHTFTVQILQDRDFSEFLFLIQKTTGFSSSNSICHTSIKALPITFRTARVLLEKNTVKLLSEKSSVMVFKFQNQEDKLSQMLEINLQTRLSPNRLNSIDIGQNSVALKTYEDLMHQHFEKLFQEIVDKMGQTREFTIQEVAETGFYQELQQLLLMKVSTKSFYLSSNKTTEYFKQRMASQDGSYLNFLAKGNDNTFRYTKISQELRKSSSEVLETMLNKFFFTNPDPTQFEKENGLGEQIFQSAQEFSQMIDLRENFFDTLKLEKYSFQAQIKFKLIMDLITDQILPQSLLFTNVFWFDGYKMNLNQAFSPERINKKIQLLKNLKTYVTDIQLHQKSQIQSHLFKTGARLIEYLTESLIYFETNMLQKSEERMELLNQRLFMKQDRNHVYQYHQFEHLNFQNMVVEGPQRNQLTLKVVEAFLTFDCFFIESEVLNMYASYLNRNIIEVILSKRYLEEAKLLLPKSQSPINTREFAFQQNQRHELQNKAIDLLFKNSLNANYNTSVKLMVTNFMYMQCIMFSLQKANECLQVQRYIMARSKDGQMDVDIDHKIQANETLKIECFSFVVEFVEEIITHLNIKAKSANIQNAYRSIQESLLPEVENSTLSWFKNQITQTCFRTNQGQQFIKKKHQTKEINYNRLLANPQKSVFEAINILRTQFFEKNADQLVELKNDIYEIIGGDQPHLEMLHMKLFDLQMKKGVNNDMFKLKSPFLQEYIENNMQDQDGDQSNGMRLLQKKLQASTKHFMKIQQPLSLFNYLEEVLIQKQNSLPVEERLMYLQNCNSQLDDCIGNLSEEHFIKRKWVDEVIEILKLQKLAKNKMAKVKPGEDILKNQSQIAEFQRLSLKVISNIDELLQISMDYQLFTVQFRIIAHISQFSDLNLTQKSDLTVICKEAWKGLIMKSFTNKLKCVIEKSSQNIMDPKLQTKFQQKVQRFQRILGDDFFDVKFIMSEVKQQIKLFLEQNEMPYQVVISDVPCEQNQFLGHSIHFVYIE